MKKWLMRMGSKGTGDKKSPAQEVIDSNTDPNLANLDIIRVVVNNGRGNGHQKAAVTLMHSLRDRGFKGTFDVRFDDSIPSKYDLSVMSGTSTYPVSTEERARVRKSSEGWGTVGTRLEGLIPGYTSPSVRDHAAFDTQTIEHTTLGHLTITRLTQPPFEALDKPNPFNLEKVAMCCMCGYDTDDLVLTGIRDMPNYNSDVTAVFQPTGWPHLTFFKEGEKLTVLDEITLVGKSGPIKYDDCWYILCLLKQITDKDPSLINTIAAAIGDENISKLLDPNQKLAALAEHHSLNEFEGKSIVKAVEIINKYNPNIEILLQEKQMRVDCAPEKLTSVDGIRLANVEDYVVNTVFKRRDLSTQLVYGLYDAKPDHGSQLSGMSVEISPLDIMKRLIQAHVLIKSEKSTVLILPQNLQIDRDLTTFAKENNISLLMVDGTKEETIPANMPANTIICFRCGPLKSNVFDHIAVHSSYPPAVEGSSAIGLLESAGKPLLQLKTSSMGARPIQEFNLSPRSSELQKSQVDGSRFLSGNPNVKIESLVQYLKNCQSQTPALTQYHQERRSEYNSNVVHSVSQMLLVLMNNLHSIAKKTTDYRA